MDIFNYIVDICHIDYISDIKKLSTRELFITIQNMEFQDSKQWQELANYITKQTNSIEDKESLLDWLSKTMKEEQ